MPKKTKSFKKSTGDEKAVRKLAEKGDDTNYGMVTKVLGNSHFMVKLNMENKEVYARLCGKFRKGSKKRENFVNVNSVVLVGLRDFEDDKVDIIHVYKPEEVRQLKKSGEYIEESMRDADDTGAVIEEDTPFDFEEI
jgi:translation initiation factor 1A